jgi:hypothetical protein
VRLDVSEARTGQVYLRDYLPVGWVSGTTDVSTQVQSWATASAGRTGIAHPGTFILTADITIGSNTTLDLAGGIFKRTGASPSGVTPKRVFVNSDQAAFGNNTQITIRGGTVDRTEADGVNPYDNAIHMKFVDGLLISGVRVRGGACGIHAEGCSNARIVHNYCDSFRDKGIGVSLTSPALTDPEVLVAHNTLRQNSTWKLVGIGSSPFICTQPRTVFANNVVVSTVALAGYGVEIGGTDGSDIAVINNVFQGCGIHYGGGTGGTCTGNELVDGSVAGSAVISCAQTGSAVSRVTVANNKIKNNSATGPFAITVTATATFCVVRGNHTTGLGAKIDVRGDDSEVASNTVEGTHQAGIQVAVCSRPRIVDNMARNCGVDAAGSSADKVGFIFDTLVDPTIVGNIAHSSNAATADMKNGYYINASTGIRWRDNDSRGHTTGIVTTTNTPTYDNSTEVITVASATALTLPGRTTTFIVSGTTTITSIVATGWAGRTVSLKFSGILTLTDGSNLVLAGNFVTTADDAVSLWCDGTNWIEQGRAVN